MATIGIKIANGNFYPLLDGNDPQKKKFALIPARKGQKWTQIDFYKSDLRAMEDAQYIGRLLLGNGKEAMDEDDAIDLVIEANGRGKIDATAKNVKTGEYRQLVIWLKTVDKDDGRESAGRKIEKPETPEIEENAGLLPMGLLYEQKSAKKIPFVPICIATLSLAAACGLLWFFLARGKSSAPEATPAATVAETPADPAPEEQAAAAGAREPPEQERTPAEPPAAAYAEEPSEQKQALEEQGAAAYAERPPEQEPATGEWAGAAGAALYGEIAQPARSNPKRPPAPVRSYKAPKPIPKNGARYKVRWGDTLWDIADVFYNNPWLYTRLARYNKLRPSAILLPGVVLRIPPKL
ncbi:MAG: LysM peptidoglycan-binding domain-containing protein [Treponema sp.]|jgi:nucleoid-associated protein YgaU|nr:LysM peptidoglycan-binding domain-containing protein [Treponema sp.]